jgi:hypothetical protein
MGEVVEVGADNRKLNMGDRVVVPFTISCGETVAIWGCGPSVNSPFAALSCSAPSGSPPSMRCPSEAADRRRDWRRHARFPLTISAVSPEKVRVVPNLIFGGHVRFSRS